MVAARVRDGGGKISCPLLGKGKVCRVAQRFFIRQPQRSVQKMLARGSDHLMCDSVRPGITRGGSPSDECVIFFTL